MKFFKFLQKFIRAYHRLKPKVPAEIFTLLPPLPLKIKIQFGKQMLFDKYYGKDLTKDNLYELADTVRSEIIKLLKLQGKMQRRVVLGNNFIIPLFYNCRVKRRKI